MVPPYRAVSDDPDDPLPDDVEALGAVQAVSAIAMAAPSSTTRKLRFTI
jgi:hypothetical protein